MKTAPGRNGDGGEGAGADYHDDEITPTTSARGDHFGYRSPSDGCHHNKFRFFLCRNWKIGWMGLVTLIIYWLILYLAAASFNPGDRQFVLTVGDTWRVHPPHNLWSRTSLSIQAFPVVTKENIGGDDGDASSLVAGLEVYEFLPILDYATPAQCPPLTLGDDDPSLTANAKSPILMLHEVENTIHLGMDQYQYEYFHLNKGSILKISAKLLPPPPPPQTNNNMKKNLQSEYFTADTQRLGATNILQGYHTLQDLVAKSSNIDVTGLQNFRAKSVKKRYIANDLTAELDYIIPTSDYYVVVYDNAAPGRSTILQVSLTVQMATHYLSNVARPICSAKDTLVSKGCSWDFTNDQDRERVASTCIIAKAVSSQLTQELQSQVANHTGQGDETTPHDDSDNDSDSNSKNHVLPKIDLSVQEIQSVIVQVHAPYGSPRLILLSLAPIAVLLSLWFLENGQRCIQHVRQNGRSIGQQSSLPISNKRMLSTADNERTPLHQSRFR
jgi:hypothetical protein